MEQSQRHELVKRYAQLKKRKGVIDKELSEIRSQIMDYCEREQLSEFQSGRYQVKIVHQERKEYDDEKLFKSVADSEVWRMISKADAAKITSLIKLGVLNEDQLNSTFVTKRISLLHVERK